MMMRMSGERLVNHPPKIIDCKHHGLIPWHVICIHLIKNDDAKWYSLVVEDNREVELDYLCKNCLELSRAGDKSLDDFLTIMCIECIKTLKKSKKIIG